MYVVWQRGGGRAGVSEQGQISGRPNRSEVGREIRGDAERVSSRIAIISNVFEHRVK